MNPIQPSKLNHSNNLNKSITKETPVIAITGSSGKTTTRELIASILETKWNVLKTSGNNNLPFNTRNIARNYNATVHDGILIELGMGKPGAAERHCRYLQPNYSIITNIGTAHFGNLGNSIKSTAKNKSELIKHMLPTGTLFINSDDDNSRHLDSSNFKGNLVTIGINSKADYQGGHVKHLDYGVQFEVEYRHSNQLDSGLFKDTFFVPAFGTHNVYNALFAIAIADRLGFSAAEIQAGFSTYKPPNKRLNVIPLKNNMLLIDDTVNANPQSVRTAIDVLCQLAKKNNKIAVLGSMLELGDYTVKGHEEIGEYVANNKLHALFTFGDEAKSIQRSAINAGFPVNRTKHFENKDALHSFLQTYCKPSSVVLIKGSSLMGMQETVSYLQSEFPPSIRLSDSIDPTTVSLSQDTLNLFSITNDEINLKFGQFSKLLTIVKDNRLDLGEIVVPRKLSERITIPELPYEYRFDTNSITIGPVIGMLILPVYLKKPELQLARFQEYNTIKGLIFLFNQNTINNEQETISGFYYDPKTKSFVDGTFPYPAVLYKRSTTTSGKYKRLAKKLDGLIFNNPYSNTNKWDFWEQLSTQPRIKRHLPATRKYQSVANIISLLRTHKNVYLKPTSLAGGAGIVHVQKLKKSYVLTDELGKKHRAKSKAGLSFIVDNNIRKDKQYIVQQSILSADYASKVDFRLYLQKDKTMRWKFSGMESKIAKKGSIISNSKNRERILPGDEALKTIYGLSTQQAQEKTDEIISICKRIIQAMENQGHHLGDVAIDFIIDGKGKVWILEVQPNYAAEIKALRDENEQKVLPNILSTPFAYAKALAGFTV